MYVRVALIGRDGNDLEGQGEGNSYSLGFFQQIMVLSWYTILTTLCSPISLPSGGLHSAYLAPLLEESAYHIIYSPSGTHFIFN